VTAVPEIVAVLTERKVHVAQEGKYSKRFTAQILFEQADALLKDTGQYARWQYLRQNNDKIAFRIAEDLLERHALLEKGQYGQEIDRVHFDRLTSRLRKSGIYLYTFSQLAQQSSVSPKSSHRILSVSGVFSSPSPALPQKALPATTQVNAPELPARVFESVASVVVESHEPVRLWPDPMEFLVTPTGVIDGTVYLSGHNGENRPLSNVVLEIVDEEGVVIDTVHSESDGFYLFENLQPGTYTVRVSLDDTGRLSRSGELEGSIFIGNDATIISGRDFVLLDLEGKVPSVIDQPANVSQEKEILPEETLLRQQEYMKNRKPIPGQQSESETVLSVSTLEQEAHEADRIGAENFGRPMAEYEFVEQQGAGRHGSVGEKMRFSVMPQPITFFHPIDTEAIGTVKKVNAYMLDAIHTREVKTSTKRITV
jgi:hypothetical protein